MRRSEKQPCPRCGAELDADSSAISGEDVTPKPGDVALCLYCGQVLAFDDRLNRRAMSDEARQSLPASLREFLFQAELARQRVMREHPKKAAGYKR